MHLPGVVRPQVCLSVPSVFPNDSAVGRVRHGVQATQWPSPGGSTRPAFTLRTEVRRPTHSCHFKDNRAKIYDNLGRRNALST